MFCKPNGEPFRYSSEFTTRNGTFRGLYMPNFTADKKKIDRSRSCVLSIFLASFQIATSFESRSPCRSEVAREGVNGLKGKLQLHVLSPSRHPKRHSLQNTSNSISSVYVTHPHYNIQTSFQGTLSAKNPPRSHRQTALRK
jgi:hypothetical protein